VGGSTRARLGWCPHRLWIGDASEVDVQFSPEIRDKVADGTITVSYRLWSRSLVDG